MFIAVKPVFNRSTKSYDTVVIRDADLLLVHEGYFVYDDAAYAICMIEANRLLQSMGAAKKEAVLEFLHREVLTDAS